ncbi:exonuclease RecJ [Haloglomus litoreum]|uniref:exonuclease RecJ n=1 Tax=Haloglomus litoreum TaxID=3034026 RepID=UPI0023E7FB91|nr:exonuclease RecJ [Haloglomus sp. DT116]
MAAADPSDGHAPGASVAAACRDAGLVRLVATSDGDALAATGVLARALSAAGIPFQASVRSFPGDALGDGTDADVTVTVGATGGDVALDAHPASPAAYAAARELVPDAADPTLALAGVLAARAAPGDDPTTLAEDATAAGCEQRPGVGVPTADLVDGLAHTTFVYTPDSGDTEAYRTALAERDLPTERTADIDDDAGRRLASLLAFDAVRSGEAPPRAADAVERALRPHAGARCPFATVEGYAGVLDAVARRAPGTGVALALGHDAREAALDAWREHASAAHRAVRAADTSRYDGCVAVVTRTGPVETVARLVRDFRSPEPAVLVVGDGEAAAAGDAVDVGAALRTTAATANGTSHARGETAYARLDTSDPAGLIDAFREGLA